MGQVASRDFPAVDKDKGGIGLNDFKESITARDVVLERRTL